MTVKITYLVFLPFISFSLLSVSIAAVNSFGDDRFVLLGEECLDNATCSEGNILNSYCLRWQGRLRGLCECEPGFVPSHDRTRCLRENVNVGAPCEETLQCVGHSQGKSICLPGSGICECKSGYIQNKDMTDCLVIINTLGTRECKENVQCLLGKPGRLSHCGAKAQGPIYTGEKVCRCKAEAVDGVGQNANRCHKKARNFGDNCKIQAQCTSALPHSLCIGGKCEKHPAFDVWRSRVVDKVAKADESL